MSQENDISLAITDVKNTISDFKSANDKAVAEIKNISEKGEKVSADALAKAEKAVEAANKAASEVADIEQHIAAYVAANGATPRNQSLGDLVIGSAEYKAYAAQYGNGDKPPVGASMKTRIEANTLTGQDGASPPENSDLLVPADRRAGIVPGAFRALRIIDMLTTIPTSSNSVEYLKEGVWTNNAAPVNEGEKKPESAITFTADTANIRTIAHFIKFSVQLLADAPAVRAYVDKRMIHGLNMKLETQLLTGDGNTPNIKGMLAAGNYQAFTPATGETAIDSINRAKYAIIASDYAPTALVMNPADWGAIERLKTSDLSYLVGNPFGQIVPVLWGLPIVVTNSMPIGNFHMADFATAYDHYARQGVDAQVGYENDDFTRNLVTLRVERRDGLATVNNIPTQYGSLTQ